MATPDYLKEAFRLELLKFRSQAESNLSDADKARKKQVDTALSEVMRELETARQLDSNFTSEQIGNLFDVLRKARDIAVVYNFLIEVFSNQAKENKLLGAIRELDIGRFELIQMYLAIYATACVLPTELFKLLLLFQIKGVHKVSEFNSIIPRLARRSWPTLEPFVNNQFRNALAHGLYTVEKERATLYKNSKLEIYREMTGPDFIMEVKNQNIVFWSALIMFLVRTPLEGEHLNLYNY